MCFKNLPVEFDQAGRPYLREGVADPYAARTEPAGAPRQLTPKQIELLLAKNGYIRSVDFDPVTRVAGALAFHTVTDLKERKVKLLIYNSQVSETLTKRLRDIAVKARIPVLGVTETMPPNIGFQDWIRGELDALDKALSGPNS